MDSAKTKDSRRVFLIVYYTVDVVLQGLIILLHYEKQVTFDLLHFVSRLFSVAGVYIVLFYCILYFCLEVCRLPLSPFCVESRFRFDRKIEEKIYLINNYDGSHALHTFRSPWRSWRTRLADRDPDFHFKGTGSRRTGMEDGGVRGAP